ncbi:MAG: glycosyltransferase [FCB group bacterium]|nr:glycosyltransferase [FCB group bacterium]
MKKDDDLPELTVVVCAKDEERYIEACIRSIFAQDYPKEKFSVIAVNDRSEDHTPDILEKLAAEYSSLSVIHISECPEGISPKKNAIYKAMEICRTEFVVATDADALHMEQWLRSYGSLCGPKLGASTGISIFSKDTFSSKWERTWQSMQTLESLSHNVMVAGAMSNGFAITANGNNMLFRKDLLVNDKAFQDHVVSGDDSEIVFEAQRRQYEVVFNAHPHAVVRLVPQKTIRDVINQRVRWASNITRSTVPVAILGTLVVLFYFTLVIMPLMAFFNVALLWYWGGLVLIKAFCDFFYMTRSLKKFQIPYRFVHLFLMELVHALFIVVVGLFGTFGTFTWKGSKYKKTLN